MALIVATVSTLHSRARARKVQLYAKTTERHEIGRRGGR